MSTTKSTFDVVPLEHLADTDAYLRTLDAQRDAEVAEHERQQSEGHAAAVAAGVVDPRAGRRSLLTGAKTAAELDEMILPATEYAIPGLIPEGASMIVSAPKIGKSWMVLGIAQAIAEGGTVFGCIRVQKRPVLYLALEDGWKRLQNRRRKLGGVAPDGLTFLPVLEGDARETIAEFLDLHAGEAPVVIVDTLQKIRGVYGGADKYAKDYEDVGSLKDLADACPGSSLIIVHHTRKAGDGDFLDSVSGTQGIAGALDAILAIRRTRGLEDATLYVTARDAAEGEYAMRMSDGVWTLTGGTLDEAAAAVRQGEATRGLGDVSERVVRAVAEAPDGITPRTLAAVIPELAGDNKLAGNRLKSLADAGRIIKLDRGKYGPVPQW